MTETLIHPPRTMLEVWESLPEGTLCQIINNKLVMSPAPRDRHQVVLNKINIAISKILEKSKIGEIRIAPYDVYFSEENIFQPDILCIKTENLYRIQDKGLVGSPDLVVEILSFSTSRLDYDEKKIVYEKYGVQEYFIVEPDSKFVTSFYLKDGEYEEQENMEGKIKSVMLNTTILF
ncbi:MAG: Uma2 family endonuclease [Bacteroidota bacterium]|nr:Uma2 family endonuclease [Bacteroidota bacterium]